MRMRKCAVLNLKEWSRGHYTAVAMLLLPLRLLSLLYHYYHYILPRLGEEHAAEAAAHPLDRTAQARL